MNSRVLVVAAHPDDEVLGCGGTIARHIACEDEVHVLIVTRGIAELFPDELIQRTRSELRQAHQVMGGCYVHFLDFPAPQLDRIPRHQLNDAIREKVYAIAPDIVYVHHPGDIHFDHQAAYHATLVACRPINGCPVRRILCYETLSETEWAPPSGDTAFVPTYFVDISDYLEIKLEAMRCYQSQLKHPPHSRSLQILEALARYRGSTVGLAAAEAFSVVRVIDSSANGFGRRGG